MEEKIMPQVHPGEILEEEFLDPLERVMNPR
jgi:plasmid maintenance system antidote protein VapI